MKKTSLILAALVTIFFISCKKDYTCKCHVYIDLGSFGSSSVDTTYTIPKTTKKKAKSTCSQSGSDLNAQAALLGGSGSCSLQ